MAPLGVHDLLKIQIYRENAKIANIFCHMIQINSFLLLVAFYMFSFSSKKGKKKMYFYSKIACY